MVGPTRGATKLGCLILLLVGATVAYFGLPIGEVYYRYYRFSDAMEQEVGFARSRSDDAIRRHLWAYADSLGLPEHAGNVVVRRNAKEIVISAEWTGHVELPLFVREFHFSPRASGVL